MFDKLFESFGAGNNREEGEEIGTYGVEIERSVLGEYVARAPSFPGVFGVNRDRNAAINELVAKLQRHVEHLDRLGVAVPPSEPEAEKVYGQMTSQSTEETPTSWGIYGLLGHLASHMRAAQESIERDDAREMVSHLAVLQQHLSEVLPQMAQQANAGGFDVLGRELGRRYRAGE